MCFNHQNALKRQGITELTKRQRELILRALNCAEAELLGVTQLFDVGLDETDNATVQTIGEVHRAILVLDETHTCTLTEKKETANA